jgi:hypothetical protein
VRSLRATLALTALALAALVIPPAVATTARPNPHLGPMLDGCQRSQSLILARLTPEWVFVDRASVLAARLAGDAGAGYRTATGRVVESRPAGEDLYLSHDYHDMNVLFAPDAGSPGESLLATGQTIMEGEFEASNIPLWAMPAAGDRVRVTGAWIWDCGHWGNSAADPSGLSQLLIYDPVETGRDLLAPGAIRGEETELHPFDEVATFRANAAGRLGGHRVATLLSHLDVWINGDGGPARAEEECALFGLVFNPVTRRICSEVRDMGGDYRYVMDLGTRPDHGSRIVVNPVKVAAETHPAVANVPVKVVPDAAAGTVTVSFSLPHSTQARPFGIWVEAGWTGAPRAVRHRVTLDRIHISGSLDGATEPNANPARNGPEQTPDPGEWVLYAEVSGHWIQLPVHQVSTGQVVNLGAVFDFWLPEGMTPTLFVSGHECDEPIITCLDEHYGAVPDPAHPSTELGFNDRPGRIELMNAGVPLLPGTRVYAPMTNPAGAGNEDLSDATCGPNGCYQLTVTWQRR